jgi:hypothetical protein
METLCRRTVDLWKPCAGGHVDLWKPCAGGYVRVGQPWYPGPATRTPSAYCKVSFINR